MTKGSHFVPNFGVRGCIFDAFWFPPSQPASQPTSQPSGGCQMLLQIEVQQRQSLDAAIMCWFNFTGSPIWQNLTSSIFGPCGHRCFTCGGSIKTVEYSRSRSRSRSGSRSRSMSRSRSRVRSHRRNRSRNRRRSRSRSRNRRRSTSSSRSRSSSSCSSRRRPSSRSSRRSSLNNACVKGPV